MTRFYLIRHADKKKEIGDPGLSEVGKLQAKKTALYLANLPISAIYSSPFARTRETAQIIAQQLHLPVILEPTLRERMNWEVPDQTFEEFLNEWEYASLHPDSTPQSGDSVITTAKRLEGTIRTFAKRHRDDHVVLVTHGGIIQDFLITGTVTLQDKFIEQIAEGIHECSITEITSDGEQITIHKLAATHHL